MKTGCALVLSVVGLFGSLHGASAANRPAYKVPTPAAWVVSSPSGRTVNVQIGGTKGDPGMDDSNAFHRAKQVANSLGGGTTVTLRRFKY